MNNVMNIYREILCGIMDNNDGINDMWVQVHKSFFLIHHEQGYKDVAIKRLDLPMRNQMRIKLVNGVPYRSNYIISDDGVKLSSRSMQEDDMGKIVSISYKKIATSNEK